MKRFLYLVLLGALLTLAGYAAEEKPAMPTRVFETDVIKTKDGDVTITFFGHGSVGFAYKDQIIYVDPYSQVADYAKLPKANLILITHEHQDHLDPAALAAVRTPKTTVIINLGSVGKVDGTLMKNGDTCTIAGIPIAAVPAYNIIHKRDNGQPFHPKGQGNGYIVTFADKRVYVAGDTENIPGMAKLGHIAVAFLPMNLPYTMTPEMVADAARAFKPKILYPYHFGDTDPARLTPLLKDEPGIELRIRELR